MDEYTLYLDESETYNFNKITNIRENVHFIISGIICKNQYHDTILTKKVNRIKELIWNHCEQDNMYYQKILHEFDMSKAIKNQRKQLKCEYNIVFKNKHIYNFAYDMLTDIIKSDEIIILSVCIDEDGLEKYYDKQKLNDRYQIAMNMLIENYYHFLNSVNGIGKICYESLPQNQMERIMKRYLGIKYNGTMFYSAKTINSRIKNLEFRDKKENLSGLQIADFIPNSIGRYILKKTYSNLKERNISYSVIESKLYDGNINCIQKYGSKIIP